MSQTTESTYASTAPDDVGTMGPRGGASSDMVGATKGEAAQVTREAGEQMKSLWRQAQSELTDQAASQQTRTAQGVRELADQLQVMIDESSAEGPARELVATTARRGREAAEWLDHRDPGSLLEEVQGFARRRPGAFLAIAAGVGLLAGRLSRGLSDDDDDNTERGGDATRADTRLSTGPDVDPVGAAATTHGTPAMSDSSISTPLAADPALSDYEADAVRRGSTGTPDTTSDSGALASGPGRNDWSEPGTARGEP